MSDGVIIANPLTEIERWRHRSICPANKRAPSIMYAPGGVALASPCGLYSGKIESLSHFQHWREPGRALLMPLYSSPEAALREAKVDAEPTSSVEVIDRGPGAACGIYDNRPECARNRRFMGVSAITIVIALASPVSASDK